jgi:ligand-binding SRPBCC domain-containing protein
MRLSTYVRRTRLPVSAETAFRWHAEPGAFLRLQPPFERVEPVHVPEGIEVGTRVVVRVRMGPFWRTWEALHVEKVDGRMFRDVQVRGPFAAWTHTHLFEPDGEHACHLEDRVEYALPFGVLGRLVAPLVRRRLERLFFWRHETTVAALRG